MDWADLKLWSDGECELIHQCLLCALLKLVTMKGITLDDDELDISAKLRPLLIKSKKELKLIWTLHSEASTFEKPDDKKPSGHPDFRFSQNTPNHDQYDFDVECKVISKTKAGSSWNYCKNYISDGIMRFKSGKYAQSIPAMGVMIGYVIDGTQADLLFEVNRHAKAYSINGLTVDPASTVPITQLSNLLVRDAETMTLDHFWVDVL